VRRRGVSVRVAQAAFITTALVNVVLAGLGATNAVLGLRSPLYRVELAAAGFLLLTGIWRVLMIAAGSFANKGLERADPRVTELAEQARTDSLTRLGNHRAFHHDLSETLVKRGSTGIALTLMAIDLDGLKQINDTKGHPAGDAHIRTVAGCLKATVGDQGTVYRTGGDEFMVIMPGRRNWHGLTLAHKIHQATQDTTGTRAVSIGLTESTAMEGRQLLVHQADVALYEAKRTKLSAVAYHPGLSPAAHSPHRTDQPSHDQRALAAALARAVDAKDSGTRSHSETVAQLSVAIGERLGVPGQNLERLRMAGLLHDVGKIGVADAILQKPGALQPDEESAMTEHVDVGHSILIAAELPTEAFWVLHHHERYDGTGYPEGRRAGEIPLESRIIAVADAFEAMTGSRPYREGITVDEAIQELQRNDGRQFDGRCVQALIEVVKEGTAEPAAVSRRAFEAAGGAGGRLRAVGS
jgi:diguanylate cyclase (GGDEF)-like protein/putative nucleotidyltransferase with HDIG domain